MSNEKAVRSCGSSYAYCDGKCIGCSEKEYTAYTSTDVLHVPTEQEYTFSTKCMKDLGGWIRESRKRQNELLDKLCNERNLEKEWNELYDGHKEVVRKYEIYKEIEANS